MSRWNVLIDLIKTNGYKDIAEIGVNKGKTTRKILEACELDRYWLIDPVCNPQLSTYLEAYPIAYYYTMTSCLASKLYLDNSLGLVFIDALHGYDNVLEDISLWQPKIREGGILCGDDYDQAHCEGVKQAVDEVFSDRFELVEVGRKGAKVWIVRL